MVLDRDRGQRLAVSRNGRTFFVDEAEVATRDKADLGSPTPRLEGRRLGLEGQRIVDRDGGISAEVPTAPPRLDGNYEPRFESAVAVTHAGRLAWLMAWRNGAVSLDPAVSLEAYEVALQGGRPVLLRTALLGDVDGPPPRKAAVRGDTLLIALDTFEGRRLVGLDLEAWRPVEVARGGSSFFGPSGDAYWLHEGRLDRWPVGGRGWEPLAAWGAKGFVRAYGMGSQDLLVSDDGMLLAKSRGAYRFLDAREGAASRARVYVSPNVGVGVLYDATPSTTAGAWLDPTSLRPLCEIRGAKAQALPTRQALR